MSQRYRLRSLAAPFLTSSAAFLLLFQVTSNACAETRQVGEKAGKKVPCKLHLFAKNPADWKIIPGGARGTLIFHEDTGEFTFRGGKLEPLTGYTLVRYANAPPFADLIAEGRTDRAGELLLTGSWNRWTKKIWLVQSRDLTRSQNQVQATAWHPERYLFEEKELGLPCACKEEP